jgi:Contractile injection system tube protein
MSGGFTNKPKILRGAFIEYGLSIPPLFVVFQFNPVQLTRNHTLAYTVPGTSDTAESGHSGGAPQPTQPASIRKFHQRYSDLTQLRDDQVVTVQEESIGFEIRLDATDKLNDGDMITEQFGIGPQLATLEQMVYPKDESLMGGAISSLLGASSSAFSFTKSQNPPMILFIWGRKRVLPVNITSMNITETEFGTDLNPIRATVSVNLTVIEGPNIPYTYSKAMKEAMSALNLANIATITDIVIPG